MGNRSEKSRRQRATVAQRSALVQGQNSNDAVTAASGQQPGQPAELRLPGLREVYDALLEKCSVELPECRRALDAELWVAGMWSTLRKDAPPTARLDLLLLDLIDEAEQTATLGSLLLLRALAVVGPGASDQAAAAAQRVAERLAATEQALPEWLDRIGAVSVTAVHRFTDPFGELVQLTCEFNYGDGSPGHAFVVGVDLACQGLLQGIEILTEPDEVELFLSELGRTAERNGGTLEHIDALTAAIILQSALEAAADPRLPQPRTAPTLDADGSQLLPLLIQRIDVMMPDRPTHFERTPLTASWTPERRAALLVEFLAARGEALASVSLAGMIGARIVDLSVDVLEWPPDRIGPRSVGRLVGDVIPASIVAPDLVLNDLARVLQEWLNWRLTALDLRPRARGQVKIIIRESLELLPRVARDHRLVPEYPYVADLARSQSGADEIDSVLRRRSFAVPFPSDRGDATIQLSTQAHGLPAGPSQLQVLDAARPRHRSMMTGVWLVGEGLPAEKVPARAGVVEQLWADQPAEVWSAAQVLLSQGLSRLEVLDRLGETWQRFCPSPDALERGVVGTGPEREAYLEALNSLAQPV